MNRDLSRSIMARTCHFIKIGKIIVSEISLLIKDRTRCVKPLGFLMFSRGIDKQHWDVMG